MLKGVKGELYEDKKVKNVQGISEDEKDKKNVFEIALSIKEKVDKILTDINKDTLEIKDLETINKEDLKEIFNIIELYDINRELFLKTEFLDTLEREITTIVEILCKRDNIKNFINFDKEVYMEEYFENNIIEEEDEFYKEHLENVLLIIKEIEETLADKALEDLNNLLTVLKNIKDILIDIK